MSSARYAIYLAPPPDDPLWRYGSALLGYDAATGDEPGFPSIDGIDPADWAHATEFPRVYGFHATLKAPFRLADGVTRNDLEHAVSDFARTCATFTIPELVVTALLDIDGRGFLALVPSEPSAELHSLEAAVVPHFDALRAPLSPGEIAKREPASLTDRQRSYLDRHGYPYVLEEFRPHFSLTGKVTGAAALRERLVTAFGEVLGPVSYTVDALTLFEQADPSQRFRIVGRFAFAEA